MGRKATQRKPETMSTTVLSTNVLTVIAVSTVSDYCAAQIVSSSGHHPRPGLSVRYATVASRTTRGVSASPFVDEISSSWLRKGIHEVHMPSPGPSEHAEEKVSARFVWEFIWLVALWALNRAFQSNTEQQKAGLLLDAKQHYQTVHITPLSSSTPKRECLEDSPRIEATEQTANEQNKRVLEEETLDAVAEHEACSSTATTEAAIQNEALYRTVLTKHARVLPALATRSLHTAPVKSLRTTILKREAARSIILEGVERLGAEVSRDCDTDPRASMAMADFHAVSCQFGDIDGRSREIVAPGSPAWKRLCRVVSFLKRNAEP